MEDLDVLACENPDLLKKVVNDALVKGQASRSKSPNSRTGLKSFELRQDKNPARDLRKTTNLQAQVTKISFEARDTEKFQKRSSKRDNESEDSKSVKKNATRGKEGSSNQPKKRTEKRDLENNDGVYIAHRWS